MAIQVSTREARCKDCIFHAPFYIGKQKVTKCLLNTERKKPIASDKQIRLNDFVCNEWKIK